MLFRSLQAHASSSPRRVGIFMETSAQHFPTDVASAAARRAPIAAGSVAAAGAAAAGAAAAGAAAAGAATSARALTGDWELRDFFPQLGPQPPTPCRCTPSGGIDALPMRTELLRNLSTRYPAVRLMRLHDLLSPRYGWHQQDCKARALAKWRRVAIEPRAIVGCDCTHYCHSPSFWRRYWHELLGVLRA